MRTSSMLGLSGGWLLTALLCALDVGPADPLFFPSLALGLPAVVGLAIAVRAQRQQPEPVQLWRLLGFGVLGVAVVTLSILGILAALFGGQVASPP